MLNSKKIIFIAAIASLSSIYFDISVYLEIAFITGFLYHTMVFFFFKGEPANTFVMKALIDEEIEYLGEFDDICGSDQLKEFMGIKRGIEDVFRLNGIDDDSYYSRSKNGVVTNSVKEAVDSAGKAINANCRIIYGRMKAANLRGYSIKQDFDEINKYCNKNKQILTYLEELLSSIGEINRGNYDPQIIMDLTQTIKSL